MHFTVKLLFGLLLSHFVPVIMLGQMADTNRIIVADGYIERMDNNIAVKVTLNNNYQTFLQEIGSDYRVNLYPNISTIMSVGIDYRFISASFSFTPKFFPGNNDDDIHGSTKSFSLAFATTFNKWGAGINYSKVKGYYLKNSIDFDPEWQEGDPYLFLPTDETHMINVDLGYNFNPKLSFRSLTSFTERQLKSLGSFIPAAKFEFFQLDPKLRPNDVRPNGTIVNSAQVSDNYEFVVGPGYYYNFVLKEKFYALVGGYLGAGIVHTYLRTYFVDEVIKTTNTEFALRWEAKVALGYNGRDFFTGVYLNVNDTEYKPEEFDVIQEFHWYYQFVIGIRFGSPKWLKKQMKKLDEKVKL